jgi:hypothetical protein
VGHYNPGVNANRNGWRGWQIDNGSGPRVWLESIRPTDTIVEVSQLLNDTA